MKRSGHVVNAKASRIGKRMAQWAANGMHWGDCPYKTRVMAAGRAILLDAKASEQLGKLFISIDAADRQTGQEGNCWWQSPASAIILGEWDEWVMS